MIMPYADIMTTTGIPSMCIQVGCGTECFWLSVPRTLSHVKKTKSCLILRRRSRGKQLLRYVDVMACAFSVNRMLNHNAYWQQKLKGSWAFSVYCACMQQEQTKWMAQEQKQQRKKAKRDASRCVGRAAVLRAVCSQVKRLSYLLACFVGLLTHQSSNWNESRVSSAVFLFATPTHLTSIHPDRHRATNNKKPDLKLFVTPSPVSHNGYRWEPPHPAQHFQAQSNKKKSKLGDGACFMA